VARGRNDAHRLIEEMMLAANRCAADIVDASAIPGVYRVHESPDPDRVSDLRRFLGIYGINLGGGAETGPADYGAAVTQLMVRPDGEQSIGIVQMAMLRSMKRAIYTSENAGHFALGFDSYAHFTSPIRRYADLYIHRAIKHLVYKDEIEPTAISEGYAEQTAIQCSMTERRADDATRDAVQWLKCEFMSHRIGEEFDARVSTVTDFGIFVELIDVFVDGLVHITQMGDEYFRFDAEHRQLHGERSGKVYKLGHEVRVVLTQVDMELARIDFDLVGAFRRGRKSRSRRDKRR
jgi:ribonuclease R